MASRFFTQIVTRRTIAGGAALGGVGFVGSQYTSASSDDASIQFDTSYGFIYKGQQIVKPPEGWTGPLFKIRNDYPKDLPNHGSHADAKGLPTVPGPDMPLPSTDPTNEAPWLNVDFTKDPALYCLLIKAYCWEGNVDNNFVLQDNKIRPWYHAPWMHWNQNGREPLNGLTFERSTPALEFSRTQNRNLQTWACGFYNGVGATVFGKMWSQKDNPQWENIDFPLGTCVFKILMTDATDAEVPTMKNSPSMKAVIAPQDAQGGQVRNAYASDLRLLQVDFAVRDDRKDKAPIGWVFGTFMYDGSQTADKGWDRIIPVGITWGNDPDLTQEKYDNGQRPEECWINPEADTLRKSLGGSRPSWGWNKRMNGPADNFISACASCHSVSEKNNHSEMTFPKNAADNVKMQWFRNLKRGEPFRAGDESGDYSLQLMVGYSNYVAWKNSQSLWYKTKYVISPRVRREAASIEAKRDPLRAGPLQEYETEGAEK